jgi:hypothetical protein
MAGSLGNSSICYCGVGGTMNESVLQESSQPIRPSAPRRKRWHSVLLGITILLCGVAIGGGGAVIVIRHVVLHAIHHPEEAPQRITNRVRRMLDLSEHQAAEVKKILTERQKAILGLRRQIQPQVEKELEKAKEDVAAILKPEQAKKWQERFDRLRIWFPPPFHSIPMNQKQ